MSVRFALPPPLPFHLSSLFNSVSCLSSATVVYNTKMTTKQEQDQEWTRLILYNTAYRSCDSYGRSRDIFYSAASSTIPGAKIESSPLSNILPA